MTGTNSEANYLRRATLAGRPSFIYLYAGRGVTPQKLLGETPKAFGECPAVIRL